MAVTFESDARNDRAFLVIDPAHINAADALFANLGDVFLAHEQRHEVMAALAGLTGPMIRSQYSDC